MIMIRFLSCVIIGYIKSYSGVYHMNLHDIMENLAKIRPIFHSEADFQFALA